MSLTNYEDLSRVREAWSQFLAALHDPSGDYPGAARVVYTSRSSVPPCDAVALRNGELLVVARNEHDESLIQQDLQRARREQIDAAFGAGTVQSFLVVGRDQGVKVLGDELAALGLQVQRLTAIATRKG